MKIVKIYETKDVEKIKKYVINQIKELRYKKKRFLSDWLKFINKAYKRL